LRREEPVADDPQGQLQIGAVSASSPHMIGSRLMCRIQVKNKPNLNTLSGVGLVEWCHSPCDLEALDNFPKFQDESLGIASGDILFS
jgi:hypothetical protein